MPGPGQEGLNPSHLALLQAREVTVHTAEGTTAVDSTLQTPRPAAAATSHCHHRLMMMDRYVTN